VIVGLLAERGHGGYLADDAAPAWARVIRIDEQ
jgi:hypothetical protein